MSFSTEKETDDVVVELRGALSELLHNHGAADMSFASGKNQLARI